MKTKRGGLIFEKIPVWAELLLVVAIFYIAYSIVFGKIPGYLSKLGDLFRYWG